MKINILDSALRNRAGHHFDYAQKLARHYVGAGHDVHVYGLVDMDEDVRAAFAGICAATPLFRAPPYQDPIIFDRFAGPIVQYRHEAAAMHEDLGSVRDADIWIWPTMRACELHACAAREVAAPIIAMMFWDPGVEQRSIEAQIWRDAIMFASERKLSYSFAVVDSEIRQRIFPIVPNGRIVLVPQPVDSAPIPAAKTELKTVGLFGHQREEKGLQMLARLLPLLVEEGYQVLLQDSSGSEEIAEIADIDGVERLSFVEDVAAEIARCDFVVLPYNVDRYHARGSGILTECLALGVPATAPFGTLPGRTIERHGIGPMMFDTSVAATMGAIKVAERRYDYFASNAFRTAQRLHQMNGVARCADALVDSALDRRKP